MGMNRLSLADMNATASVRGGCCLSTSYRNNAQLLRWECRLGHRFVMMVREVRRGSWCPTCNHDALLDGSRRRAHSIDDCQEIATAHGGECLSTEYVNNHRHLKWRCRKGHKWSASLMCIKLDQWCPICRTKRFHSERSLFRKVRRLIPTARRNVRGVLANRRFELDIYVPELRKAVEFDGEHWHSKPEARERDHRKEQECCAARIQLLRVSYAAYRANRREVVASVLQFLR